MGRKKKVEFPGARWHATARGSNHMRIFLDEQDYEKYIRLLGAAAARCGWIVFAFCLMPNHVHLLIETPNANLAKGMHLLQFKYANYFNAKYSRDGYLFKGRYHPKPIADDAHFLNASFYVVGNAAKAGLCKHPLDWEWSSLGLVVRGIKPGWLGHDELLEELHRLTGRTGFFEEWIG
jgi:putative transposase